MTILKYSLVLLFSVTLWGCGKGNANAPATIDTATQKHAAGWAANGDGGSHPAAYFANSASCKECHGEPTDLLGGISKVSCSNPGRSGVVCHPSFPHAVGFAAFAKHGSVARDVAGGVTGMAHCQKCHGSNYTGAVGPSCIACHKLTTPTTNAPHAANWASYLANSRGLNHSAVNESNAPACALCHTNKENLSTAGKTRVAGFTTPGVGGCFNNSLCHNQAGHPSPYVVGHQAAAESDLSGCQKCHATPPSGVNPRFNLQKASISGVLVAAGCEGCHNIPGIAHPYVWLPGRGNPGQQATSHANAGTVNASCSLCHGQDVALKLTGLGGTGPACFSSPSPVSSINGASCHFTKPVDAQGITVGCTSCHGAPPNTGKHASHWGAIPGIAGIANFGGCNACHNGKGPKDPVGNATHATGGRGETAFPAKFNENGLTASFSVATGECANVSCHGGKLLSAATPPPIVAPASTINWTTGNLTTTNCLKCHTISTAVPLALPSSQVPYIGPFSGTNNVSGGIVDTLLTNLHDYHTSAAGVTCVQCHTIAKLAPLHWAGIMQGRRGLIPGDAASTVGGTPDLPSQPTGAKVTCLVTFPGSGSCHFSGEARDWYK